MFATYPLDSNSFSSDGSGSSQDGSATACSLTDHEQVQTIKEFQHSSGRNPSISARAGSDSSGFNKQCIELASIVVPFLGTHQKK
jgi:hypothetical protein